MKNINFVLIMLCVFSCEKKRTVISSDIVDKLSTANYLAPSVYGQESLFILIKDFTVIKTNADSLNHLYEMKYKKTYANFKLFLDAILNYKMEISKHDFENLNDDIFLINNLIAIEYKKGFTAFYANYVKLNSKKKKILQTDKLSKNEFLTIQYYFYLDGYQIEEDDYKGYYYVVERSVVFQS